MGGGSAGDVSDKMTREKAKIPAGLFRVAATERIAAEYLYKHSVEYKAKFENKVFGGNEFRIITIANAIAAGVPPDAARAFEFHDHFCPGVTSGILQKRTKRGHEDLSRHKAGDSSRSCFVSIER